MEIIRSKTNNEFENDLLIGFFPAGYLLLLTYVAYICIRLNQLIVAV